MKTVLYIALCVLGAAFLIYWVMSIAREPGKKEKPSLLDLAIGFVVNFFDALGIGSFATTTFCYKLFGLVRDEDIPGTLNVGVALCGILEGLLYIAVVDVEPVTLILTIGGATVGASLGARVVSRWPKRKIQIGMGLALLITAAFGLAVQFHLVPGGGNLLALTGWKLLVAVSVTTLLGALMTLGIGFFAPCMMVTYLLGMNPRATFPIMMGAVAFLGPGASVPFIRQKRYSLKSALGLTIGGIPGILLAAFLVKSLPLDAVRWLVIAAIIYTAIMMLRSAAQSRALRSATVSGAVGAIESQP
jgi:uncharacterized membrane protein YfcA